MDKRYRYEASTVVSESEPLLASFVSVILARYAEAGHRAVPLYMFLCRALVGRVSADDWLSLTPDEWTILTRMAIHEGVAGLLWRASGRDGWRTQAPTTSATALRLALVRDTAHNIMLLTELERVLAVLKAAEIKATLLKGAALALTLYSHPGLRSMGDLDLLVSMDQVSRAGTAIEGLGYRPEISRLRQWLTMPLLYELNYDGGKQMTVHVELHWDLVGGMASRYRTDMNWFWEQTTPVQVGRETVRMLTPGSMLLHLAAHVALKHGEERALLRWFYDLHLLIEQHGAKIAWDEIVAQAAVWNWNDGLRAALISTVERFSTVLPGGLLEHLAETTTDTDRAYLAGRSGHGRLGRAVGAWRIQGWRGRLALVTIALLERPSVSCLLQNAWLHGSSFFRHPLGR